MRSTRVLVLCAAAAFAGCGGSTFSAWEQADASAAGGGTHGVGGSGTGGSGAGGVGGAGGAVSGGTGGAGGSSGAAGAQDGGKVCTPLPGCSSTTTCSDGCNTCSCFNGQWACTARACPPDAGQSDAGQGVCETDSDCIFRAQSGCCGVCLAKTDPIPPPIPCGIACSVVPPGCVCINHKCGTGTLQAGKSCELAHNLCSYGLMCCQQCGGPYLPDAQNCSGPVCTQPVFIGGTPGCPPPPP